MRIRFKNPIYCSNVFSASSMWNMMSVTIALISIIIGVVFYASGGIGIKLAVLFSIAFSLLLDKKHTILFLALLLPVNRVLIIGNYSILILIVLAKSIVYMFDKTTRLKRKILFTSLLFLLFEVVISLGGLLFDAAKIIMMLFFLFISAREIKLYELSEDLLHYSSLGIFMATAVSFLSEGAGLHNISRFKINGGNSNVLGLECAVISVCLMVFIIGNTNHCIKQYMELILVLFIGMLTVSRTFFLSVAIGVVWIICTFLYRTSKDSKRKILRLFLFVMIILIILYQASPTFRHYCLYLLQRTFRPNSGGVSGMRFEIWGEYLNVFRRNPHYFWFGNMDYVSLGIGNMAHNMIIEQIAMIGIIGNIIIIFLYYIIVCELNKVHRCIYRIMKYTAAPLISLLSASMVSHSMLSFPQTFLLFMCWLYGVSAISEKNKVNGNVT